MCIKTRTGRRPPSRDDHRWTSRERFFSTILRFKCGKDYHNIKLKGIHLDKFNPKDIVSHARLLRITNENKFLFFVDVSKHGVTPLSRKRGGYYLYIIESDGGDWVVERQFFSLSETKLAREGQNEFYNIRWAVLNRFYFKVAPEEVSEGGNTS
jgi:hypothetical protein